MSVLPPKAEMERAYLRGDAAYNGVFFLAVRTTAIFCRPNCPARKPLPKNVEYFASPKEALAAGYRPCKRCHPLETHAQPVWATKLLEHLAKNPLDRITDEDLHARG